MQSDLLLSSRLCHPSFGDTFESRSRGCGAALRSLVSKLLAHTFGKCEHLSDAIAHNFLYLAAVQIHGLACNVRSDRPLQGRENELGKLLDFFSTRCDWQDGQGSISRSLPFSLHQISVDTWKGAPHCLQTCLQWLIDYLPCCSKGGFDTITDVIGVSHRRTLVVSTDALVFLQDGIVTSDRPGLVEIRHHRNLESSDMSKDDGQIFPLQSRNTLLLAAGYTSRILQLS